MKVKFAELAIDLVGVAGAAAITFGAWSVYRPAGWIVGGALALVAAVLLGRSES